MCVCETRYEMNCVQLGAFFVTGQAIQSHPCLLGDPQRLHAFLLSRVVCTWQHLISLICRGTDREMDLRLHLHPPLGL